MLEPVAKALAIRQGDIGDRKRISPFKRLVVEAACTIFLREGRARDAGNLRILRHLFFIEMMGVFMNSNGIEKGAILKSGNFIF